MAMLVYGIIGAIGVLFLLLSFIIGEFADAVSGLFDHGVDAGTDSGDMDGGPSFFSIRSLAAFIAGFGVIGFIFTAIGWHPLWASLPAMGMGLIMFFASYGMTAVLYRQQVTSSYNPRELVGQVAEVTTPIPFSGLGEVSLIYKGTREHHAARSIDNEPIEAGCRVSIVEFLGGTATVARTAKVK